MKRSSSCSLFLALIFIILTTPPFCKLQSMLRCIIMKLNSSCVLSPIWIYPLSRSVKYLYRGCRWQVFQHQHCLSHRHPRFHSNREMNVLPEYEDKRYDGKKIRKPRHDRTSCIESYFTGRNQGENPSVGFAV